ncbi:unnamed protein product, partial [Ectocarpus sp. 12 AP-2014]
GARAGRRAAGGGRPGAVRVAFLLPKSSGVDSRGTAGCARGARFGLLRDLRRPDPLLPSRARPYHAATRATIAKGATGIRRAGGGERRR